MKRLTKLPKKPGIVRDKKLSSFTLDCEDFVFIGCEFDQCVFNYAPAALIGCTLIACSMQEQVLQDMRTSTALHLTDLSTTTVHRPTKFDYTIKALTINSTDGRTPAFILSTNIGTIRL